MGDRLLNRGDPASADSLSCSMTANAVRRGPLRKRLVRLSRRSTEKPSAFNNSRSRLASAACALRLASTQSERFGTPASNSWSANNPSLLRPGSAVSRDGKGPGTAVEARRADRAGPTPPGRAAPPDPDPGPHRTGGDSPDAPHRTTFPEWRTTRTTGAARLPFLAFQAATSAVRAGARDAVANRNFDRMRALSDKQTRRLKPRAGLGRPRSSQEIGKKPNIIRHRQSHTSSHSNLREWPRRVAAGTAGAGGRGQVVHQQDGTPVRKNHGNTLTRRIHSTTARIDPDLDHSPEIRFVAS